MRKKPGFALRSVCGEQFLIAEGEENIDFSNLVSLNESSVFLWNLIGEDQEFTIEFLVEALLSEYKVSREEVSADVRQFCDEMIEGGIITE